MPLQLETIMHVDFNIMRLIENRLSSSQCSIKMNIAINPENHSSAKNRIKAMKVWLEQYLEDSIAFSTSTTIDTSMLEGVSNNLVMCPEEPHDYLLLALIHAKMSAIADDEIVINKTSFIADTSEGFETTMQGTTEDWLPTMTDWVGPRHFHKIPWWDRSDSSTIDMKPNLDDDLTIIPKLGVDLITLVSEVDDVDTTMTNPINEQPAEIIRPKFKPRIITSDD